ncbi:NAD-dependent succinate-semialdehyde dehydrogenase [Lentibacillus sp. N15]|uniref:NAD-dependent succinate-semialdehyde dehydrogenase n=1 Tax=Lentibacillus songyuanensis TaxID=3136161 RepID=UPI0031B9BCA9
MKGYLFINGKWEDSVEGKRENIQNPATGEIVGTVPASTREDAARAINAADESFKEWSSKTAEERANYLYTAYEKLMDRADEVATLLTKEQGKPFFEAKGEVLQTAKFLQWYSEEAKRIYGETIPASSPSKRLKVIRQPVGVVAAITPWNFPSSMVTRKIAPALAAGCTVVLKPAESTPLTAIILFEVFEEAGFPAGVVNLITGDGPVLGEEFLTNSKVKKITFTGSTEVGKHLIRGSADQIKKVSLELGGHAPFIIFDDADLDQAVEACVASKFRNAGQTCISANRIYVQDTIIDTFTRKFIDRVQSMKIGNGFDSDVEIGPLIDKNALEKVQGQVQDATAKGAEVLLGGETWKREELNGIFYKPTIIGKIDQSMRIYSEETFGPVAPIIPFTSEDEVIDEANNVQYGLSAYVFTTDLGRSERVPEKLEYGIVGVNDPLPGTPQAPFGGWKESGIGREGGHYGLDPFLEIKYISTILND